MKRSQRSYAIGLSLSALLLLAGPLEAGEASGQMESTSPPDALIASDQVKTSLAGVLEKVDILEERVKKLEIANSKKNAWWLPVVLSVCLGGAVGFFSGRIASWQEKKSKQSDSRFLLVKLPEIREQINGGVGEVSSTLTNLGAALDHSMTTPFFSYEAYRDDDCKWMSWWDERQYLDGVSVLELPKLIGAIDAKNRAARKLAKLVTEYDDVASQFADKWNSYVDFISSLSVFRSDRLTEVLQKYGAEFMDELIQNNAFQADVKSKYDELVVLTEQISKCSELVKAELKHIELVLNNAA